MHRRPGQAAGMRGRDGELAAIDQVLRSLTEGVGGIVLIEGEAGIGKSRALEETRRRAAAAGSQVIDAVAEELEQARPFGPLVRALMSPRRRVATIAPSCCRRETSDGQRGGDRCRLGRAVGGDAARPRRARGGGAGA